MVDIQAIKDRMTERKLSVRDMSEQTGLRIERIYALLDDWKGEEWTPNDMNRFQSVLMFPIPSKIFFMEKWRNENA